MDIRPLQIIRSAKARSYRERTGDAKNNGQTVFNIDRDTKEAVAGVMNGNAAESVGNSPKEDTESWRRPSKHSVTPISTEALNQAVKQVGSALHCTVQNKPKVSDHEQEHGCLHSTGDCPGESGRCILNCSQRLIGIRRPADVCVQNSEMARAAPFPSREDYGICNPEENCDQYDCCQWNDGANRGKNRFPLPASGLGLPSVPCPVLMRMLSVFGQQPYSNR